MLDDMTLRIKEWLTRGWRGRTAHASGLALALGIIAALPTAATAQEDRWQLRFGAAWVQPDVVAENVDDVLDAVNGDTVGVHLALERRFGRRFGVELGASRANTDFRFESRLLNEVTFRSTAELDFTAYTAGLNVHLTPDRVVDLYLGPMLVYSDYGDADITVSSFNREIQGRLSSSDDFAFGVQLGADIGFGDGPWSLNVAAQYIDTRLDLTNPDTSVSQLKFDPLLVNVGFGFRF